MIWMFWEWFVGIEIFRGIGWFRRIEKFGRIFYELDALCDLNDLGDL